MPFPEPWQADVAAFDAPGVSGDSGSAAPTRTKEAFIGELFLALGRVESCTLYGSRRFVIECRRDVVTALDADTD
jgi:hypothetical protein